MRAVIISIQPKWVEKICRGEKTVEVRKTKPKLDVPFKVYIYCTNNGGALHTAYDGLHYHKSCVGKDDASCINGKVIGEFVCDRIIGLAPINKSDEDIEKHSCLSREQIVKYLRGKGYGWHITDLVVYEKPRELGEFYTPEWFRDCEKQCDDMERMRCPTKDSQKVDKMCGWCRRGGKPITRPPQSWCYIEPRQTADTE